MRASALLGMCLGLSLAASNAAAECKLQKMGELPVVVQRNQMLLPATLGDHQFMFLVDTGATYSIIDESVVKAAGIEAHNSDDRMYGVGGRMQMGAARLDNLTVAGIKFPERRFLVNKSGGLSKTSLLGYDVLGMFDVEFDVKNSVIRLYKTSGCGNTNMAYWGPDRADMVEVLGGGTPQVAIRLDGKPVRATLDSGASSTVVPLRVARSIGVEPDFGGQKIASSGADGRKLEGVMHKFASFEIGAEEIKHPALRVIDGMKNSVASGTRIDRYIGSDMLLGFDFFRSHRIFILNDEKKIFFTYEGGNVFAPSQPAGK